MNRPPLFLRKSPMSKNHLPKQAYCLNKWGTGFTEPSAEYLDKYRRMMAKYGPLPEGWKEMYDPGVGRHYFWCTR